MHQSAAKVLSHYDLSNQTSAHFFLPYKCSPKIKTGSGLECYNFWQAPGSRRKLHPTLMGCVLWKEWLLSSDSNQQCIVIALVICRDGAFIHSLIHSIVIAT